MGGADGSENASSTVIVGPLVTPPISSSSSSAPERGEARFKYGRSDDERCALRGTEASLRLSVALRWRSNPAVEDDANPSPRSDGYSDDDDDDDDDGEGLSLQENTPREGRAEVDALMRGDDDANDSARGPMVRRRSDALDEERTLDVEENEDDEEENEDEDEERFTDDGRLEVRPTFLPALFLNRSMFIGSFHDITEPSFEPAYTLPPATASDVIDLLAPRRK